MSISEQLREKIAGLSTGQTFFDPGSLNDPIALKTKWTPAKGGGTNVGTHQLKKVSPNRVEFRPRTTALVFPTVFMIAGLVVGIGMSMVGLKDDITMLYFGLPFGALFFLVGFFIFRSWREPRVFDRRSGLYWRGHKTSVSSRPDNSTSWALDSVHAIQLISEHCTSNSTDGRTSSYYSYELNLVLKDGGRLNVVDHGKHALIVQDAHNLASFLTVPLWDAT